MDTILSLSKAKHGEYSKKLAAFLQGLKSLAFSCDHRKKSMKRSASGHARSLRWVKDFDVEFGLLEVLGGGVADYAGHCAGLIFNKVFSYEGGYVGG